MSGFYPSFSSSLRDVAEDLPDDPNSASTISGVRRRSEPSDLTEEPNFEFTNLAPNE